MTFTVTVARRANPRVKALRGKAKDKFWEAVSHLEHEGCAAGAGEELRRRLQGELPSEPPRGFPDTPSAPACHGGQDRQLGPV